MVEKLYNSNTYSDIYKVMFAQMCPSCKVMIVRSEGCKFMECGKCRFQFCWNCLEEFYTEQHMYYSTCPLRIVMIYAMIALACIAFTVKFMYTFTIVSQYLSGIFGTGLCQLMNFSLAILIVAAIKKGFEFRQSRSNLDRNAAGLLLLSFTILFFTFTISFNKWLPNLEI
jgi:hypothetical protein